MTAGELIVAQSEAGESWHVYDRAGRLVRQMPSALEARAFVEGFGAGYAAARDHERQAARQAAAVLAGSLPGGE